MAVSVYNRGAVSDLLDLLTKSHPNVHWYQRGSYVDQQGDSLVEIVIYEGTHRKIRGTMVYNARTGQVASLRYLSYPHSPDANANAVDVLLDLINFEKSGQLMSV